MITKDKLDEITARVTAVAIAEAKRLLREANNSPAPNCGVGAQKKPIVTGHSMTMAPEFGVLYWSLGSGRTVFISGWHDDELDLSRLSVGNVYLTEADAYLACDISIVEQVFRQSAMYRQALGGRIAYLTPGMLVSYDSREVIPGMHFWGSETTAKLARDEAIKAVGSEARFNQCLEAMSR